MAKKPTKKELDLKALRESERELRVRNRIAEIFLTVPDDQMYAEVLDVVLKTMKSKFGIFGYVDENGDLVCPSMTRDIYDQCQIPEKDIIFPRNTWGGIWGKALIEKKTHYANKPFNVPQGHIPVNRAMVVPIIHRKELVGMIHIANKTTDYDSNDKALLETIADRIAPVLHARLQRNRQEKERKQAEEALKESEEKYRSQFEDSLDGIVIADAKTGIIIDCNPAIPKLVRRKKSELVGQHQLILHPPEEKNGEFSRTFKQHLTKHRRKSLKTQIITKDGRKIDVSIKANLLNVGDKSYLWGFFHDITERKHAEEELDKYHHHLEELVVKRTAKIKSTVKDLRAEIRERKRAEEALKESEQKHRNLYETMAQGVVYQSADGKIISVNPAAERILGLTLDQMQGRTSMDPEWRTIHEDGSDFPGKAHPSMVSLKSGKVVNNVVMGVFNPNDEKYHWININAIPQFLPGGKKPYQVYTTFSDITERKRAEETLLLEKQKLDNLSNHANCGLLLLDGKTNITYANKFSEKWFGPLNKIKGRPCWKIFKLKDPENECAGLKALRTGKTVRSDTITEVLHGEKKTFYVIATPIKDSSGKVSQVTEIVIDITERKRAEDALETERQRFFSVLDALPAFIYLQAPDYSIRYTNSRFRELFGDPKERLCYEAIWGAKKPCEPCPTFRVFDTKKLQEWEWTRPDDGRIYMIYDYPFTDTDGSPLVLEMGIDITERKKAEEALKESRGRYRSLVDNINMGITLIDTDYNIAMINATESRFFNKDPSELIGKKCYSQFERRKKVCPHCPGTQAMATGLPQEMDTEGVLEDGTRIPVHIRAFPTFGPDGKPTGFIEVIEDISERKIMEEKLQKETRLRSALLDNMPCIGMILKKGTREIVACNDVARQQGIVVGKTCYNTAAKRDTPCTFCRAPETWKTGEKRRIEVEYMGVYYEGIWVPLSDDLYVHYIFDITERKKAEKELVQYREHLEDLVAERTAELKQTHDQLVHSEKLSAIGKLSASIAHEFNNPIFGIRNVLGGIKKEVGLDKENRAMVNLAIKECNRVTGLIKKLQDFHRPTSGTVTGIDIHKAINDMLLLCKKEFTFRKIKIRRYYARRMPEVQAVADQFRQVILNLLNNAAEAIPRKGGSITITTKALDKQISIRIHDSGKGIKQKDINQIFEPFFSTKPAVKGTGLGLSISYGIIKKHGGNIRVISQPDQGTTFIITLPIKGAIR